MNYIKREDGINAAIIESSQGMVGRTEYYCGRVCKRIYEYEEKMKQEIIRYYN